MSAVGFAYGSQLSPARGPVSRGTYQGRASSLYSPAAAGCGRLGRSLLSWASVRARFYHICLSSFTTYMHVFVTCCCFLCERFAPVVAAHCTARSSAAPSAPLFLLSRPPPLLAPLVPSLLSVLPSPPSVWGCCLPWVLSLPAGREFFGVGWCLFHLPHALWELAWLISALVSPLPCPACPRAAARGSKSLASLVRHVSGPWPGTVSPFAACSVLQRPHLRAPAAQPLSYLDGTAAPLYSGGAAARMCEWRSRSALLYFRTRLSSTSTKWGSYLETQAT